MALTALEKKLLIAIGVLIIVGSFYYFRSVSCSISNETPTVKDILLDAVGQTRIDRAKTITPSPRQCSIDGRHWFPARSDGICYMADAPIQLDSSISRPEMDITIPPKTK